MYDDFTYAISQSRVLGLDALGASLSSELPEEPEPAETEPETATDSMEPDPVDHATVIDEGPPMDDVRNREGGWKPGEGLARVGSLQRVLENRMASRRTLARHLDDALDEHERSNPVRIRETASPDGAEAHFASFPSEDPDGS